MNSKFSIFLLDQDLSDFLATAHDFLTFSFLKFLFPTKLYSSFICHACCIMNSSMCAVKHTACRFLTAVVFWALCIHLVILPQLVQHLHTPYLYAEQLPTLWHMYQAASSLGGFAMANWQTALTWPILPVLGHTHCLLTEWGTRPLSAPLHPSNPFATLCGHMFPAQGHIPFQIDKYNAYFFKVRSLGEAPEIPSFCRHLNMITVTTSPWMLKQTQKLAQSTE